MARRTAHSPGLRSAQEPAQPAGGATPEGHVTVSESQTGPDNAGPDRRGGAEGRRAYLRDLMGVLERSKEGAGADAASLEAVSKQLEVFDRLQ